MLFVFSDLADYTSCTSFAVITVFAVMLLLMVLKKVRIITTNILLAYI